MSRSLPVVLFCIVGVPAMAQYAATGQSDGQTITPKNGQTPQQVWNDRYDCYRWAVTQSGFDPNRVGAATAAGSADSHDQYSRAFAACIEGRGYAMRSAAPPPPPAPTPPPPPPSRPPVYAQTLVPQKPVIKYHPIELQIDGGYTVASSATGDYLHNGANAGLGLTWFPAAALPVGLRVDGSYNWLQIKDSALNSSGSGYTQGNENIYGGDLDLQFDLAHRSDRYKLYLFGGAGRYREATHLRSVQLQPGIFCGYFFCGPGVGPVETASDRGTSPWLSSWNAGLGFETAVADRAKFFVEARYLRIGPASNKQQFVPIRVGFRF